MEFDFLSLISKVSFSSLIGSNPSFVQNDLAEVFSFLTLAMKVFEKDEVKRLLHSISKASLPKPLRLNSGSNNIRETSADSLGTKFESPINPIIRDSCSMCQAPKKVLQNHQKKYILEIFWDLKHPADRMISSLIRTLHKKVRSDILSRLSVSSRCLIYPGNTVISMNISDVK